MAETGEHPDQGRTPRHQAVWPRFARAIKPIGGLAAVAIGVAAVTVIAVAALAFGGSAAATVATSTSGVIGSMVGAFFGVKIGTDQTKQAAEGERAQAAKTTVFAAHLPKEEADRVLAAAEAHGEAARGG